MKASTMDSFWNSDLEAVESPFLKGKKITDLTVHLDNRVPPQGRMELGRTVNVDTAVSSFLAKTLDKPQKRSVIVKLFDRIVFG